MVWAVEGLVQCNAINNMLSQTAHFAPGATTWANWTKRMRRV